MKVFIDGKHIRICQLLKKIKLIPSGGLAKIYIKNHKIKINDNDVKGKNSKVVVGSKVIINERLYYILPKI